MGYGITVYMDKRDVTDWITSVTIEQVDSIHRKFALVFGAWHSFDQSNRWDIFESYDKEADPRSEIVIRNGVVPEDRQRLVKVRAGDVPTITAEGYEYIWLAKRRAPQETVILIPSTRNIEQDVGLAIANYKGGEIGAYRVWAGARDLHTAIKRLMAAARIRVQVRLPNYEMAPYVVNPKLSYWKAVEKLSDPYAPVRYYQRSTNTIVIADPTSHLMGAGSTLNLPDDAVNILDVQPQRLRRIRRVLGRKTRWL